MTVGDFGPWPLSAAKWVDLTLLISERYPTWPYHMPFQHKIWNWFSQNVVSGIQESRSSQAYHTGWYTIDEHTGTHFDAPTHFIPPPNSGLPDAGPAGEVSGDRVPLSKFHGPARLFDVRSLVGIAEPGKSAEIGLGHLVEYERAFGPIVASDVVIFASGWDRFYLEGDAGSRYALDVVSGREPGWPAPTLEMIKALAARGVTTVGTDAPSIGLAHDGRPVHVFGHGLEMIFLESLANLAQMPQSGAYFIFLPVKVAGSSGGPGRAVGIVPFGAMQGSRT